MCCFSCRLCPFWLTGLIALASVAALSGATYGTRQFQLQLVDAGVCKLDNNSTIISNSSPTAFPMVLVLISWGVLGTIAACSGLATVLACVGMRREGFAQSLRFARTMAAFVIGAVLFAIVLQLAVFGIGIVIEVFGMVFEIGEAFTFSHNATFNATCQDEPYAHSVQYCVCSNRLMNAVAAAMIGAPSYSVLALLVTLPAMCILSGTLNYRAETAARRRAAPIFAHTHTRFVTAAPAVPIGIPVGQQPLLSAAHPPGSYAPQAPVPVAVPVNYASGQSS